MHARNFCQLTLTESGVRIRRSQGRQSSDLLSGNFGIDSDRFDDPYVGSNSASTSVSNSLGTPNAVARLVHHLLSPGGGLVNRRNIAATGAQV